jgi:hypothetical protein
MYISLYVSFYLTLCNLNTDIEVSQCEQYQRHCAYQKSTTGGHWELWGYGVICTAHKASHGM